MDIGQVVQIPEPEGPFLPASSLELSSSDFLGLFVDTPPPTWLASPRGLPLRGGSLSFFATASLSFCSHVFLGRVVQIFFLPAQAFVALTSLSEMP